MAKSKISAGMASLALELSGVSKHFGGTKALDNAHFQVRPGTVHGLLGGNGSGKSTLIKILAGAYRADAGRIRVGDHHEDLSGWTAAEAAQAGLRFVHQDLGLFNDLSIAENFALDAGYPLNSLHGVNWKELHAYVAAVLREYELDVDPRHPVGELRASDRTMVAIARALQSDDGQQLILVLDEPTAKLAAHESQQLLDRVRRRADKGQTVVIVSHRLKEVLSVGDDFTVLRDGVVQGTLSAADAVDEDDLIALMAGGLTVALKPTGTESHTTGKPMLEVNDLISGPLDGVSLTVHEGEILGIAGLVGSGCSSLLQALFGAYKPNAGDMSLDGKPYAPDTIDAAMKLGVAFVPENRVIEAAFMDRTVSENMAVAMLAEYWTKGWMPRRRENHRADELIDRFKIKVDGAEAVFSSMSGGNQQKVVLARWLQRSPRLLLLDEPTQGVDVMSRADIYATIRSFAKQGTSVVVASSDMSEIHALCDRVVFLSRGRITQEVLAGELDVDALTALVLREPSSFPPRSTTLKEATTP